MQRLTENKIILVTRSTRVAELKRRFNTRTQAKFYVSHLGQDFSDYEREDEQYANAVRTAEQTLRALGRDRKSTRLNSSHSQISYAVFCLKKKKQKPDKRRSMIF